MLKFLLRGLFTEGLRVALLVSAGIALMASYLTHGILGASDAYYYVNTVGDFILQVRAGVFPVWVGQTPLCFYGGIFPLRVAPYLQHLAALVDLLTGRNLPVFTVLNVTLTVSLVGGLLGCYFCLRSVMPNRPWAAVLLSFLYASCPGVVGLTYTQDLYLSFMTLPFLPFVFLGIIRSFEHNDAVSRLLMAGGLAAAWLAHPPIALWCGAVAILTQIFRLWHLGWNQRTLKFDFLAIVAFGLLAGYSFVSAAAVEREVHGVELSRLLLQIQAAFPGNWLPVHRAIPLENIQLGYSLTVILFGAALAAVLRRDPPSMALSVSNGVLLMLILPIPYLTPALWHLIPATVIDLTNIWPMQRLFVLLALCSVFGAAVTIRKTGARSWQHSWLVAIFLLLAVGWSAVQASRLVAFANLAAPTVADSTRRMRSENLLVPNVYIALSMRSAGALYASGGVMAPELEHRFLDRTTRELRSSVVDVLAPGFGPGAKPGTAQPLPQIFTGKLDANPGVLDLSPALILQPGRRYLLVFEFMDRPYRGTLIIQGKEFFRQYALPSSGAAQAFGSEAQSSRVIPLWTSLAHSEEVQLQFVPSDADANVMGYVPFARFELKPYDPDQSPVKVDSWIPYRAQVRSDASYYLVTPRLAVQGYYATVDGRSAPVEVSPDGCVMLGITRGVHSIEIRYQAPGPVRLAYWIGAASWLALLMALVYKLMGKEPLGPTDNPRLV